MRASSPAPLPVFFADLVDAVGGPLVAGLYPCTLCPFGISVSVRFSAHASVLRQDSLCPLGHPSGVK